jgi:membrane-bound metal-dependent hydrolase YbcI (DUF457 family)
MLIGLVLGIILTTIKPDKLIIPVCMAYSIIPDIIDKYLGLTYGPFNSGRTVVHSLLFVGIITLLLLGVVLYTHHHAILLVAAPLALILHQLFDEIWLLPTTWLYPLLGPFLIDNGLGVPGDWFWGMVMREVTDPVEWLAGIGLVIVMYLWYDKRWMSV